MANKIALPFEVPKEWVRDEYRGEFILALRRCCPSLANSLAQEIYPLFLKHPRGAQFFNPPKPEKTILITHEIEITEHDIGLIRDWAKTHNLDKGWIVESILTTLVAWNVAYDLTTRNLDFTPCSKHYAPPQTVRQEFYFTFIPDGESKDGASIKAQMDAAYKQAQKRFLDSGWKKPRVKPKLKRNIDFFVQRRFNKKPNAEIAGLYDSMGDLLDDESVIDKGIEDVETNIAWDDDSPIQVKAVQALLLVGQTEDTEHLLGSFRTI